MKIGFIGTGNMGSAIMKGIIASGVVSAGDILGSARSEEKKASLEKEMGIQVEMDNSLVARHADVLVIGVKPNIVRGVLREVFDEIDENKIVVSIAAGVTIEALEDMIGENKKIIRVMPNTPALVRESMSAICINRNIGEENVKSVEKIFSAIGKTEVIEERLMDAVIGVSGSSPAYVYMMIEAMADAAVRGGMKRDKAHKFAAQSVMGAAKMVLETGIHPGELKDMVCSPAGTTIEAVSILEEKGFRNAIISAQTACAEKSKQMSQKK